MKPSNVTWFSGVTDSRRDVKRAYRKNSVGRLCGVSADYHYTKGSMANYAIVPSAGLILLALALLQPLDKLHDRSNKQSLCYRERPVLTS